MKIYLANVGANLSEHRFAGPVFEDGRFEFLPIPADDSRLDACPAATRYCDLRSHYDPGQSLHAYVPPGLLNEYVLRSPESSRIPVPRTSSMSSGEMSCCSWLG